MRPAQSLGTEQWDWDELGRVALQEAQRIVRSRHDAEDAAQEAIIRAYRYRLGCSNPSAPQAWVRTIAQREAYRLYARSTPSHETGPPPGDEQINTDEVEPLIERLSAQQALQTLPAGDRELVVRRYLLDQSSSQIAAALAIPAATVRVRLHRALKRLQQEGHATH